MGVDQGLLSALTGFMYQLLFRRYLRFFDRSSCFVDIAYAGSCPGYVLSSREGRYGSKKYKSGFPVFGNKTEEINSGYWGTDSGEDKSFIRVHIQERRTLAKAYRAIETSAIAL